MQSDEYTRNAQCVFIHFNMNGFGDSVLIFVSFCRYWNGCYHWYDSYYATSIFAKSISELRAFPF